MNIINQKIKINSNEVFGFNCNFEVFANEKKGNLVPNIDQNYVFEPLTTQAILAGFMFNQRVLIQGMHGTGKSTHIEQVAARLNWQCMRINFDSQITRLDLIGKDVIKLQDQKQITEFKEGIIPFAIRNNVALILDEYDAIRMDVAFVIHQLLENDGKFMLLEENEILQPSNNFRLFATSNTLGAGDDMGIYHGTNLINQAQMDRWNIAISLNYLDEATELKILQKKVPILQEEIYCDTAKMMIKLANITREAFKNGDISNLISLRTLISWGNNIKIFNSIKNAFAFSFLNKVIDDEKIVVKEFYQRIFGEDFE